MVPQAVGLKAPTGKSDESQTKYCVYKQETTWHLAQRAGLTHCLTAYEGANIRFLNRIIDRIGGKARSGVTYYLDRTAAKWLQPTELWRRDLIWQHRPAVSQGISKTGAKLSEIYIYMLVKRTIALIYSLLIN